MATAAAAAGSPATAPSTATKDTSPSMTSSLNTPSTAAYPSELRSPMMHSPYIQGIKQEEGGLKTPITPPSAYIDFLKAFSPALHSPASAGASSAFSYNKASPLCASFTARTPHSATFTSSFNRTPISATFGRPMSATFARPSNASAASCASATSAASNLAPGPASAVGRRSTLSGVPEVASTDDSPTTTSHPSTSAAKPNANIAKSVTRHLPSAIIAASPSTLPTSTTTTTTNTQTTTTTSISTSSTTSHNYPYPTPMQPLRRSSTTSSTGAVRPTLRIPQSPLYSPSLMRSPASTAITTAGPTGASAGATTPHSSLSMTSPADWEPQGSHKKERVHVRHIVTRTITYCRTPVTPLEPAPKGKRRRLDGEASTPVGGMSALAEIIRGSIPDASESGNGTVSSDGRIEPVVSPPATSIAPVFPAAPSSMAPVPATAPITGVQDAAKESAKNESGKDMDAMDTDNDNDDTGSDASTSSSLTTSSSVSDSVASVASVASASASAPAVAMQAAQAAESIEAGAMTSAPAIPALPAPA